MKTKSRKKSAPKKLVSVSEHPDHFHVVYMQALGKIKPGIYEKRVTFDGPIAFVHPDEGRHTADVVPAANVFVKKEDAQKFFASDGQERWIVTKDESVPQVFRATVRTMPYKRYGKWTTKIVMVKVDGKPIEARWDMVDYPSEKDAYRHIKSIVAANLKQVEAILKDKQEQRKGILLLQEKIKSMGISRGYRRSSARTVNRMQKTAVQKS